ncbi:MAG: AAA family ATPase, partial [Lentimicrobiaceae bacterium]|nr:AAA family ATPase [Lentimicrobiaceae bacterium]
MLVHLRIENYALIRHLSIPFNEGFTVITGETGAGKSILLGALSLILGQRADTQVLMDKSKKCFVEGTFKITGYDLNSFFEQNDLDYEDTLIIRREINSAGKSRAFINDTPVTLSQLKEISEKLVDIHSQHETVELNTYSFQMDLVDDFAGNQQLLKEYKLHFREYMALKALLSALREKEKQSKTDQDYYAFLLNELNEAHLVIGEQTALETELDLLTHSETIKTSLFAASQILQSSEENVTGKLNEVASVLKNIARLHPEIESYLIRIQESIVELKDVASDIEKLHEKVNFDQERIEQINQRLQLIFHLEQKHRVANPDELIKMQEKIAARLNAISHLDTEIAESENIFFTLEKQLFTLANQIVQSRNSVKKPMETAIVSVLNELGMPDSRFSVDQQVGDELTGNGIDKIRFL